MDLAQSEQIGLQRALVERETARAQLAEARTQVMMLRSALQSASAYSRYTWPDALQEQVADALDWTMEDSDDE